MLEVTTPTFHYAPKHSTHHQKPLETRCISLVEESKTLIPEKLKLCVLV